MSCLSRGSRKLAKPPSPPCISHRGTVYLSSANQDETLGVSGPRRSGVRLHQWLPQRGGGRMAGQHVKDRQARLDTKHRQGEFRAQWRRRPDPLGGLLSEWCRRCSSGAPAYAPWPVFEELRRRHLEICRRARSGRWSGVCGRGRRCTGQRGDDVHARCWARTCRHCPRGCRRRCGRWAVRWGSIGRTAYRRRS